MYTFCGNLILSIFVYLFFLLYFDYKESEDEISTPGTLFARFQSPFHKALRDHVMIARQVDNCRLITD